MTVLPDETPPVTDTPVAGGDQAVPAFDPNHEWPTGGGCYVRHADGTLTRED